MAFQDLVKTYSQKLSGAVNGLGNSFQRSGLQYAPERAKAMAWEGLGNTVQAAQNGINWVANRPRIELPSSNAQNPIARTAINLAKSIPESIINAPRNYVVGIARTGQEIGQAQRYNRMLNAQNLAGGIAPLAEGITDIGSLGLTSIGKGVAKEGAEQIAKQSLKQVVLSGAKKGALMGGAGGLTYGLDNQYGNKFNAGEVAGNVAGGALLGGIIGGSISGLGGLKGLITKPKRVESQLIDKATKWVEGDPIVKPKGMTKNQWEFQQKFNKQYGRNPYEPVYAKDIAQAAKIEGEKRVGLSIRTKGEDVIPSKYGTTPETSQMPGIEPKFPQAEVQSPLPQTPQTGIDISLPNDSTKVKIGNSSSVYNAGRINGNQEVIKQAVAEVAPSFEKAVGGPITHKEIIDQAEKFSSDVIKTIGRQTTEELGAAQLRLRQNIASMADSGQVTPDLLEAMKADAAFARSNAQLLGQRSINADPQTPYGKNLIKYVEAVNKVANDIDAVYEKAKGVDFNNKEQASAFYRQFIKPTAGDWMDKVRYSSMLSSPNTVINNISSNYQGTGILTPIEKTVSGGLDAIVSGITGRQRQHFAGEGVEYAKGYASNLKPAVKNFVDAMKGGSDASEMYDIPLTKPGTIGRKAENALSFFPRLAQATDEFFSTLTSAGLEKANAYRVAKGGVAQTEEQIALETKRRLFNQPFGSDQSHMLNFIEYIPSKIMEASHSSNPFIKWTAKFIFPFVRIPANVFKAGVEYSPLGFSTLPGANNKIEQASKALMGTSVALGAWSLANSGRLTFGMPTSEKQRDAFTASGLQPYSIKIGDKWVGYTKFHPAIGFNLALASAVKEQMDNQTISDSALDQVTGIASKWLTYFANQSFVKQMGDFMDLSKGNEAAIGKAIGNYPSQLIPYRAFMGWIARAFDPYERKIDPDGSQLDKSLQSIIMSIPGDWFRGSLKTRVDSNGQPIKQQNRFLNLISPGKVTQEIPQEKVKFDTLVKKSMDTKKENAIKDQMKKSGGQISEYNGKYFVADKEFNTTTGQYEPVIRTIDTTKIINPPKLTGSTELDKKIMSKFNGEITSKSSDIVDLFRAGKLSASEAETQLQQLKALRDSYKKSGTKKLKKVKPISIKIPKMKSIKQRKLKLKKPKLAKITVRKMKSSKLLTTKA